MSKKIATKPKPSTGGRGPGLGKGGGAIVMGALAPHPPHLVYAENPPQNEPRAECGWETLRWGYERLRKNLSQIDYDVIVLHTPHWQTMVGTHVLATPHLKSLSVDPVFPNLFRYHYDLSVDVDLADAIATEATDAGLLMKRMTNPDFRVDYGTIISCHLTNPKWDKPIVAISSHRSARYFSTDVMQTEMTTLGRATARAIAASGKRALVLASQSLSHRHFTTEGDIPEDMSREHINSHHLYLWDMKIIDLLRRGKCREVYDLMPDFVEQCSSEADAGSLTWLLAALDFPRYEAEVHAYGTVIGTGNAIIEWDTSRGGPTARQVQ